MHIDEELFKQDSFKKKLEQYEEARFGGKSVFMDIDDLTDIIDYYNYDGMVDNAEDVADYALTLYPGAIGPLVFKARQALAAEDFGNAEELCERIEDKTDIDYFYLCAEVLIAKGMTPEAENMLNRKFMVTDIDEQDNFCLDVSALYIDYGHSDLALVWLERTEDTENPEWIELRARIYSNTGEYERATECLEELIDKNPFVSRYWNMLALIQLCDGEYPECLSSAEYSLAVTPGNSDGLWCKAKALLSMDEPEKALEYYRRFLSNMPDNARAEADMGACYLQLSDLYYARQYLESAEKHCEPDDKMLMVQIYEDLAYTFSCMQDLDKALAYLKKAETLSTPALMERRDPNRMVLEGHVLMQNKQKDKAMAIFDKAIEASDESPEVILKVCVSLYDHEEYETGIAYFRHLETIMPEGWNIGFSYMAACLLKNHQMEEGLEYLKKACMLNSQEVKGVFSDIFPPDMPTDQYYDYIKHVKF